MKTHTTDFKNEIKQFGREIDSKITYEISGVSIELGKEQINSVTPHYQSNILKSTMKQLDIDSNVYIAPETVINYQFGLKVGNSYEYIDYGNYVVYEVEKQEDTRSWKITCYDKMLYAMKPYENLGVTYPITIKNYLQAISTKLGLTLKSNDFVNADKEITSELYLDGDGNSLEYTYRDVLDELAQVTASVICINENDELEVRYPQNVGEYETKEGTSLSIENVDDGSDLAFDLNGNTVQDGTPTPDSPIAVETVTGRQAVNVLGKNVFDYTTTTFSDPRNVNIETENDMITITTVGTHTSNDLFFKTKIPDEYLENSVSYTLSSVNVSGVEQSLKLQLRNKDGSTANKPRVDSLVFDNSYSLYITGNIFSTTSSTSIPSGTTAIIKNVQVEKGTQSTSFEEFKGNTYEINLGKNLFDINGTVDQGTLVKYNNGLTLTKDINRVCRLILPKVLEAGTYTLSMDKINSTLSSDTKFGINVQYNTTQVISIQPLINGTFTTTSPFNKLYFFMNNDQADSATITIDNIQLEKGSVSTSFATYFTPIELCKIGDYKNFIRKGTGKNLCNYQALNLVTNGNGTTSMVNGYYNVIIDTKNMSSLYVSGNFALLNSSTLRVGGYNTYPAVGVNGTRYSINSNNSFSIGSHKYIMFSFLANTGYTIDDIKNSFMINEGNSALPYEPYGYKDKWYLYKTIGKIVLNGSETWVSWNSQSSGNTRLFGTNIIDNVLKIGYVSLSNYFTNSSTTIWSTDTDALQVSASGENQVRLRLSRTIADGTTALKTWLSTNNTSVYYVLVIPITTEITDTELINQLESVKLLEGLNNVLITSSNLSTPIKMTYLKYFDTIDEEYLKDVNVNFGEKFGPVNSVVLSRSAESDNIYRKDDESVEENGLTEIKIKDNQILNGNNRDEYIDNIFNKLKGLEYYVNDYVSTGISYLESGDIYKVKVENNSYKCLMLNDELDVTQGLSETIHTEKMEDGETDYSKADKTDRKINQAYIIVDKQNQQITSVVQNINTLQTMVNSQGEQIDALGTNITQTINNITASVTSIQEELDNGVSLVKTTTVTVDDEGLTVATDNSKTTTIMTSDKFAVRSGGKDLAFFGYDDEIGSTKAEMDNLTVTNYFVAGYHRIEKYDIDGEQRTGVFYIGE